MRDLQFLHFVMAGLADKMLVRDRILTNISTAIKQIQEMQCLRENGTENDEIVLTNDSWQVHRLCEHLDHAFLYGLRHVSRGYWSMVKEFTHKEDVKMISSLPRVLTDIGRGRAWLYLALNENNLESYVRCFMQNEKLVRQFYVKHALLLDVQCLQVLLTLAAGLEFIMFSIDLDVPYLDLQASCYVSVPRTKRTNSCASDVEDAVSLCSMESEISQLSRVSSKDLPDSDYSSLMESSTHSSLTGNSKSPRQSPKELKDTGETHKLLDNHRIRRLDQISYDNDDASLEVIRVRNSKATRKRTPPTKLTDKGKKSGKRPVDIGLSKSGKQALPQRKIGHENHESGTSVSSSHKPLKQETSSTTRSSTEEKENTNLSKRQPAGSDLFSPTLKVSFNLPNKVSDDVRCYLSDPETFVNAVQNNDVDSGHKLPGNCLDLATEIANAEAKLNALDADDIVREEKAVFANDEVSVYDLHFSNRNCDNVNKNPCEIQNDVPVLDTSDIVELGDGLESKAESQASYENDSLHVLTKTSTVVQPVLANKRTAIKKPQRPGVLHESEIKLDNNTLLLTMLDVAEHQNEQFYKMFHASTNHTEGEVLTIFLMLTDRCMYFLRHGLEPGKYRKEASMGYTELDYISLSINYQTINLVCHNKRRQFWICTGDENLTRSIVSSIEIAIRRSPYTHVLPNVLTDATMQKVALRKWIAKETCCEMHNVDLRFYSLTHWEDLDATLGTHNVSTDREGMLMHLDKSDIFTGPIWKSSFFVLKNGWLYQYQEQFDKVPSLCLQISGPEMGGCRRCPSSDVPNTFELITSDGSALTLAGSNEHEAADWMYAFLQIVSQGVTEEEPQCIVPCALVMTRDRVLMCHEELQTGFVRTLGSAILHDLVSISVDSMSRDYCVMVFEYVEDEHADDAFTYMQGLEQLDSHSLGGSTKNAHWILYFTSEWEQHKFLQQLCQTWQEIFQTEMPVHEVKDGRLREKCREEVLTLRDAWKQPSC